MGEEGSGSSMPVLYDYQIESMWNSRQLQQPQGGVRRKPGRHWRERVQHAVSHALNEYYSTPYDVRCEIPVQYMLEKWWPKQHTGFESCSHYWDVKNKVTGGICKIGAANQQLHEPAILFEQFQIPAAELNMELSVIIQAAWMMGQYSDSLLIQKYMVSYDPHLITAHMHFINAFSHYAFGYIPEMIEFYCLLEGRKVSYVNNPSSLGRSIDYVTLLRGSMEESGTDRCLCPNCMERHRANLLPAAERRSTRLHIS
ncbi:hypothetical protein OIN60_07205 [Paenibacillus sp. P96]|uniref:Uncharacterized protein n=1 Tax=Paenibacillus zeirhizosphaerae TaxID=2987519 RepID=A0ABT9FP96_9BACL|nr:hypothetical protein [Paenibacillus sp. P96]MDP4096553.1 hypothetical protein [Paenibacillus sp. P96]